MRTHMCVYDVSIEEFTLCNIFRSPFPTKQIACVKYGSVIKFDFIILNMPTSYGTMETKGLMKSANESHFNGFRIYQ